MAARLPPKNGRPWTPERVRERIRTGLLLRRLQDHALGSVEMTKSQVAAAEFLLSRIAPRAEAPRNLNVTGTLTLTDLIHQAIADQPEISQEPTIQ